jgi:HAD superfamily hydrolase (TIGR01509 family)
VNEPDTTLRRLLGRTRAVLFDFDGPLCDLFVDPPAAQVAAALRHRLAELGHPVPTDEADDPMEALREASSFGPEAVREVEDLLTESEIAAAATATPNPAGEAALRACLASGRQAAIVSNNAPAAVNAYLARRGITELPPGRVIGRRYANPDRLKPDPDPVRAALAEVAVQPSDAVMVGDQASDVEVARAAGVACIGFADTPAAEESLRGADVVLTDMGVLADLLTAHPRSTGR